MRWLKNRYVKYFSLLLLISLAVGFTLNLKTPITLQINDDGREYQMTTTARDLASLLKEGELKVGSHDKLNVAQDARLYSGMEISIQRARKVTIQHGEETSLVYTHAKTVKDALEQASIQLKSEDRVTPTLESPIEDNLSIQVKFVTVEEEHQDEKLAFQVIYREDPELEFGKEVVLQEGEEGILRTTTARHMHEGEVLGEYHGGKQFVKQPVDRIVARGTYNPLSAMVENKEENDDEKPATTASAQTTSNSDTEEQVSEPEPEPAASEPRVLIMEATAYNDIGTTASGIPSGPGKVAVDPNVIPLGTKLLIESMDGWESYGYAIAADTGGVIIGHKIDLFYYDLETCLAFGRRQVKVTILED